MTLTEAIISGIVQGLTEFLPISSSGHLVLVHRFFGLKESNLLFDICLHAATVMAVILYFSKDIIGFGREKNLRWLFLVGVGTVPAVLAGYFFEEKVELFFLNPLKVAFMLIITGLVLFVGHISLIKRHPKKDLIFSSALCVGIAQAFALLPGISRSGSTISTAFLCGMKPEQAFRFSFILSIPIVIGAVIYKIFMSDAKVVFAGSITNYIVGMVLAFITGLLALRFLWQVLKVRQFYVFGIYCIVLGVAGIIFFR